MMKIFRMFGRSVRDALKSVKRNFSLSLASITCIAITLLIVSISLMASFNVKNFSRLIKDEVTMVVFMNLGTTQDDLAVFEEKLRDMENVETFQFKSSSKQKEELLEEDEFWESVFETLGEEESEIFHHSYLVKVKDIEKIGNTANEIKKITNVQLVNYGEGMVEQLISAFNLIEKIAFLIVAVLILVTIFLIVNTIKLTIFSRKREISIMRVVGASNWTIKNPFIIEGMILGAIGSILPILVTVYGYTALYNHFEGKLFSNLIQLISPVPFVFFISIAIFFLGIVVGMIGSNSAVRRYLKI